MMKKITYFATTLALLTAVSCMNEKMESPAPEAQNSDNYVEFTASTVMTKTTLGDAENGFRPVLWTPDDKIAVTGANTVGVELKTDITEPSPTATFKGNVTPAEAGKFYAIYPKSAVKEWITEYLFKINVPSIQDPSTQDLSKDSFPNYFNISYATTTDIDRNFVFKNCLAYIKVKIVHNDIVTVSVMGDTNIQLAGDINLQLESQKLIPGYKYQISDMVQLQNNEKSPIKPGVYYIGVLPGIHENGLRVVSQTSVAGKPVFKALPGKRVLEAGKIYYVGEIK